MGFLSSASYSSKLIEHRRGSWEPVIYKLWVRSTRDTLGLLLLSEVGAAREAVL